MDASLKSTKVSRIGTEWFAGSFRAASIDAMRDSWSPVLTSLMYTCLPSRIRVASTRRGRSWLRDVYMKKSARLCFIGSQADVESLRNKNEASLLLTKMQSIQGEVAGEACSPWIPKTVDGLSTRFHGKIVALVLEMVGYTPGLASGGILRWVDVLWPWMTSCVHMKAI